jgi:hypothetical protein
MSRVPTGVNHHVCRQISENLRVETADSGAEEAESQIYDTDDEKRTPKFRESDRVTHASVYCITSCQSTRTRQTQSIIPVGGPRDMWWVAIVERAGCD